MNFRSITIVLLLLGAIITPVTANSGSEDEWYPFVIPEKLDPNSPVNIGKLVLDPPAGKHGFCKVKDGHFYFEDGTRAKFWGTNLAMSACFPTREQAEMLADRLSFFGFNAVRLHHMDYAFEPAGIFKDVCPAYKDPQKKKTGVLSEKQLERLDYLIYQLKLRGIYVDMNLLVTRHFTEADGVKDAEKLGMAAKGASFFDQRLIELQKQYAKDLLTHYNPYSKLRYCDDPSIALVEITNENTLEGKLDSLPVYYKGQLSRILNVWYKSNPFASQKEFAIHIEQQYFNEMTAFLKNDLSVKVPIAGSQYPSLQALTSCDFIDKHAYWDHPEFSSNPWNMNDFRVHNKSLLTDSKLGFISQLIETGKQVKDCDKPYAITEWNHCYPNQYAYETPVLLAGKALENDWDALFQFAFSHGWQNEPVLDSIQSFFDIMPNSQQLMLCSFGSYLFLKEGKIDAIINSKEALINSEFLKVTIDSSPSQGSVTIVFNLQGKNFTYNIGMIKNRNSGWQNGRFLWGNKPVLMKGTKAPPF